MEKFSLKDLTEKQVFIIAEIGNNHNGSARTAKELINIASEAKVDAVKFQTFTGLDIVNPLVRASEYKGWDVDKFDYWYQFLNSIALPLEKHREVFDYAIEKGLIPFSTPTSPAIVEFLETLDVPLYKIASMDLTNVQLLKQVAATGKPVILSSGMGVDEEIQAAKRIFANNELAILHCVSDYPTKPENANLKAVSYLIDTFGVIGGLSDHAINNEFAIGSIALGGRIIEKHITYSRAAKEKAEHHFSLEKDEFTDLVAAVRRLEQGIGIKAIVRSDQENENKSKYRRSLHLNRPMRKGEVIREEDIAVLRPNIGDAPSEFEYYVGKLLVVNVAPWTGLEKSMVGESNEVH
jgi:sialic acid synthase SpsE